MSTQLYLARGIVDGRIHSDQDQAMLRDVAIARADARRERRRRRAS